MNRKQIIVLWIGLSVILSMVVVFAVTVWPTRYKYLPGFSERTFYAVRVNRLTGKGEYLSGYGWVKCQREKEKAKKQAKEEPLDFSKVPKRKPLDFSSVPMAKEREFIDPSRLANLKVAEE